MLYPNNTTARDAVFAWMEKGFYKTPPGHRIRSLVPLSGGMDSVVLLATLLTYTDHDIHAHHVEIRNRENRANAESQAIEKILGYMTRNYRPFTYTSSKYEMMLAEPKWVGADIPLVMFMLSRVNLAMGHINDIIWTAHMKGVLHEYMEAAAVHAAAYTNFRAKPIWAMPFMTLGKTPLYNSIPPELAALCWSCRFPTYDEAGKPVACNDCHACRAVVWVQDRNREFREQQAAGAAIAPTPVKL